MAPTNRRVINLKSGAEPRRARNDWYAFDAKNAMLTLMERKISASAAWEIEIGFGRRNRTVSPPRSPWTITAPSAAQPRVRRNGFGSRRCSQKAWTSVMKPTVVAIIRCPCS